MNQMQTYAVTLTGISDLIMHHDNIDWADYMEAWKNKPENNMQSEQPPLLKQPVQRQG